MPVSLPKFTHPESLYTISEIMLVCNYDIGGDPLPDSVTFH